MTINSKKGPRTGRKGTGAPIAPHRVIVFKPSAILKRRINSPQTR